MKEKYSKLKELNEKVLLMSEELSSMEKAIEEKKKEIMLLMKERRVLKNSLKETTANAE